MSAERHKSSTFGSRMIGIRDHPTPILSNLQNKKALQTFAYKTFFNFPKGILVGVTGFEPAASWSRTKRSTELSHTPLSYPIQLFSAPPKESTALRLRSPRSPISSRPHSAASSATGSAASLAEVVYNFPELSHTPLSYLIILFCSPYTESPLSHPIKPHRTYLF